MNQFVQLPGKERGLYFVQTAERMRISPQIVEKDFWVCWILSELFALPDIGNTLIFKGGTSLSKAYQLIKRFSEDVDISINRASLGFDEFDLRESVSNTERKRRVERLMESCRRKITEELRPAMIQLIESRFKGMRDWSLEIDADDADRQTLLYKYPSSLAATHTYVRPVVRIEFGARSDHWPSCQAQIMSYVAQQFPKAFQISEFVAKVLMAERTFWEKATLLHTEYHRPVDKEMPPRLSRHYYDLSQLILSGLGNQTTSNLELLRQVVEHKKLFFPSGWAHYDEAQQGSLHITPFPSRIRVIEEDYDHMQEMFFSDRPEFTEVLKILDEWEDRFN